MVFSIVWAKAEKKRNSVPGAEYIAWNALFLVDLFENALTISFFPFFLQFQTELRKILVSLIEVAQKLLALNPDAVDLFKKANGMKQFLIDLKYIWCIIWRHKGWCGCCGVFEGLRTFTGLQVWKAI